VQISILLFGPMAQRIGRDCVAVEVAGDSATVDQVLAELRRAKPTLASDLVGHCIAVNHAYANGETLINAGDEVAAIGMVSGG